MLNSFNATGRVATKNVNQTATGVQYVKFVLAISRGKDKPTDFIPCTIFGNTSKFFISYIEVGNMVSVSGKIQSSNYEKDGKRITALDCFISSYDLIPIPVQPKQEQAPAAQPIQQPAPAPAFDPVPPTLYDYPVPPPQVPPPAPDSMPFNFY